MCSEPGAVLVPREKCPVRRVASNALLYVFAIGVALIPVGLVVHALALVIEAEYLELSAAALLALGSVMAALALLSAQGRK